MQRIAKVQLHGNLAVRELRLKLLQCSLIFIGLQSKCQLPPQIGNHRLLPCRGLRIVHDSLVRREHFTNQLTWLAMHAYQQTTDAMYFRRMTFRVLLIDIIAGKRIDIACNQLPSTKVEVTYAEVGPFDAKIR